MTVITVSREFGSIGDDFGEKIAQALGYHCVCKEFIADLLSQYGMVDFDTEYEKRLSVWQVFDALRGERRNSMVQMLNEVLQAVAQHGNVVIQGRSGFAALAGLADALHVRVQAPLPARIERVAAQQHVTAEEAGEIVKEGDRVRTGFVEAFYGVPWNSIHAFDMVVNTEKVPPEGVVAWVVQAAEQLALRSTDDRPTSRQLEVDGVLAKAVSKQLACASGHC